MSDSLGAGTYQVSYRLGAEDAPVPAGSLAVDATLRLQVVAAEERFAKLLDRAVRQLNALPHFTISVPPPPDAPRFGVHGQQVAREAPEAGAALRNVLEKEYGLLLAAA